eukprot:CAMPEP_0114256734 /NCGR_PEP_ID=MMETSP0058-20121206/18332_1 /TAXON_ID=36894 /ORGANISM="Pyramimonas parkeae, CCMP726" /LENGTH=66 /DNA_ID=CAMNT_0001371363 /DNA_START=196 /DNA_END=396 /DNA_ORIENTATION=-
MRCSVDDSDEKFQWRKAAMSTLCGHHLHDCAKLMQIMPKYMLTARVEGTMLDSGVAPGVGPTAVTD